MPQSLVQSLTNTFVKGLITEAGPLTFPKDASIDERNMVLLRDGSRRRRLGLAEEADFEYSDFGVGVDDKVKVGVWQNVAGTSKNYCVIQVGSDVYFYEMDGGSISPNRVPTSNSDSTPYVLDLTTYEKPTSSGAETTKIEMASFNGVLIIVSEEIEAIYVEQNTGTGAFTVTEIDLEERDFEWLGRDGIAVVIPPAGGTYYDPVATASIYATRKYDTYNAGWVGTGLGADALTAYTTAETAWPPLTHPWYSGKDSSGNFSVSEYKKIYLGTSLTAIGHYIYSIFYKDRSTQTGIGGISNQTINARFSCVCGYAGRVFYSGLKSRVKGLGSRVYFSQLITDNFEDIGKCFQRNDPTSEEFSDLLDTDGGFISIPEAHNIQKLHVFGPTLYVFAENGVWGINGVDDVFRATEYSVSKLTEVGLNYKESFVSADGRPYWWSANGIHTLALNDQIGTIVEQDLSTPTIKTYWSALTNTQKSKATGVYDGFNNRVTWMYPGLETVLETRYNNLLIFDEVFSAFYPWAMRGSDPKLIVGAVYDPKSETNIELSSNLKFLLKDDATNNVTFAEFSDTTFKDFGTLDYRSFAVAGYDFLGDLTIQKNAPFVTVYLERTESGFTVDALGNYDPIRPSSCLVSAYWDFDSRPSSTQQAYKLKYPVVVDPSDLTDFDYPTSVITTRLKVRGRGRSFRLQFEAEDGKDLHLYGFEVIGARNPSP